MRSLILVVAVVIGSSLARADVTRSKGDAIARGEYLVNVVAGCGGCHTPKTFGQPDSTRHLAGWKCFLHGRRADGSHPGPAPAVAPAGPWCGASGCEPDFTTFGCLSSSNLTNHETGLKYFTDAQVKEMIQNGRRPNGQALSPIMPYWMYRNMTDEDVDAMIAYLRTVPGVEATLPPNETPWLVEQPSRPIDIDKVWKPKPDAPNYESMMRGRYLASFACIDCHTPWKVYSGFPMPDNPLDEHKFFAGSGIPWTTEINQIPDPPFPWRIYSQNLTQDPTGLLGYSVDDLRGIFRSRRGKDGSLLCPPHPSGTEHGVGFGYLTDQDVRDIANYVLALPATFHPRPSDCRALGVPSRPQVREPPPVHPVRIATVIGSLVLAVASWIGLVRNVRSRRRRRWLVVSGATLVLTTIAIIHQLLVPQVQVYDAAIGIAFYLVDSARTQSIMHTLSLLGSTPMLILIAMAVAGIAWRRGRHQDAWALAAVVVATKVLIVFFAWISAPLYAAFAQLHGSSFPSADALRAAAVYSTSAWITARLWPRIRLIVALVTPLVILAAGIARVSLTEQWATDAFLGFAVGLLVSLAGILVHDTLTRGSPQFSSPRGRSKSADDRDELDDLLMVERRAKRGHGGWFASCDHHCQLVVVARCLKCRISKVAWSR